MNINMLFLLKTTLLIFLFPLVLNADTSNHIVKNQCEKIGNKLGSVSIQECLDMKFSTTENSFSSEVRFAMAEIFNILPLNSNLVIAISSGVIFDNSKSLSDQ